MIRYIYTFFLGLFLAIFVGMGIAMFYTEPKSPEPPAWYGRLEKYEPTAAEKKQEQQYNSQQKNYDKQLWHYNRNVSAIVLGCAVIILAISLLLAEKLGVIADGLLLGGIFTLLYGIGRGMTTDSNKYRFAVAAVGLMVTLGLGYFKFTKPRLAEDKSSSGRK
jgi:hypothetical protein